MRIVGYRVSWVPASGAEGVATARARGFCVLPYLRGAPFDLLRGIKRRNALLLLTSFVGLVRYCYTTHPSYAETPSFS